MLILALQGLGEVSKEHLVHPLPLSDLIWPLLEKAEMILLYSFLLEEERFIPGDGRTQNYCKEPLLLQKLLSIFKWSPSWEKLDRHPKVLKLGSTPS